MPNGERHVLPAAFPALEREHTARKDDQQRMHPAPTVPSTPTSDESASETLERFLTATEIAALLSVHANYIYDLAARGLIPSYKIGGNRRFRWSEIEPWLDRQRTTAYASTLALARIP